MGIPYSKEINHAFVELNKAYGQVTPLIAAAYEVLETSKNISFMVAGIQVLNTLILSAILLCMIGLLINTNPDLDKERKELVTPVLIWITGWAAIGKKLIGTAVTFVVAVMVAAVVFTKRDKGPMDSIEADGLAEEGKEDAEKLEDKEKKDGEEEEGKKVKTKTQKGWIWGTKEVPDPDAESEPEAEEKDEAEPAKEE